MLLMTINIMLSIFEDKDVHQIATSVFFCPFKSGLSQDDAIFTLAYFFFIMHCTSRVLYNKQKGLSLANLSVYESKKDKHSGRKNKIKMPEMFIYKC